MKALCITSPAFAPEGIMPHRNCGYNDDLSPEIHIDGIPEGTLSLAVTLDDLDHPIHPGYNHWSAWNIAPVSVIPEGIPWGAVVESPLHAEQGMAYGKHCYRGPKPPFNWKHRYRFTVYALDCLLNISTDSDKKALLSAIDKHILAEGCLHAVYQHHAKKEVNK